MLHLGKIPFAFTVRTIEKEAIHGMKSRPKQDLGVSCFTEDQSCQPKGYSSTCAIVSNS